MTFVSKGWGKKLEDPTEQHTEKPDVVLMTKVFGPGKILHVQWSIAPRFIAKILVCPDFPPLKIPRYTAKLGYLHPPQVFRHKSRKTKLNSPVSTAHNYPLTAVY